jgi:hypothetical protein
MTDIVYQTNLGGNLTLRATNTASNPIVTIPSITGNIVTTGDTATVTANMITPGALSQTATYLQGSSGSVSRTIQNKLQESVSVKDFGAVGDGVTDDTTAFINMRNSLISIDPNQNWRIYFGKGNFTYNNNKWLCGLRNVILDLGGGTITYTQTNVSTGDYISCLSTASYQLAPTTDTPNSGNTVINGFTISSCNSGDSTLSFIASSAAANFSVGEPILIAGYDFQPLGYPSNFQYFEYNIVQSVNTGTNQITVQPLKNAYKSTWPLYTSGGRTTGPGQVFKLINRAGIASGAAWPNVLLNIKIMNGTWNGTNANHNLGIVVGQRCIYENMTFNVLTNYGFSAEYLAYKDCYILGEQLEIDKIVETCLIQGGYFNKIRGATGVTQLEIDSTKIQKDFVVSPTKLIAQNVTAGPSSSSPSGISVNVDTESTILNNCNFQTPASNDAFVTGNPLNTFTVYPTYVSGGNVQFTPDPNNPLLKIGLYLMKNDASVYGKIVDVINGTPNTYVVQWTNTGVSSGDTLYAFNPQVITLIGQNFGPTGWPGCILDPFDGSLKVSPTSKNMVVDRFNVFNKITSISINVIKAGTSGSPSIVLRGFGGSPFLCSVNANYAGVRTITASAATGAQSGDDLSGYTNLSSLILSLRFDATGFASDPSARPIYTVTINCNPLLKL